MSRSASHRVSALRAGLEADAVCRIVLVCETICRLRETVVERREGVWAYRGVDLEACVVGCGHFALSFGTVTGRMSMPVAVSANFPGRIATRVLEIPQEREMCGAPLCCRFLARSRLPSTPSPVTLRLRIDLEDAFGNEVLACSTFPSFEDSMDDRVIRFSGLEMF